MLPHLPLREHRFCADFEEYHRDLRNHGINEYSYDEFIHDYRAGHLYNMILLLSVVPRLNADWIKSDGGQLWLQLPGKRLQAIVDRDCGKAIPD